jgi:hypothetical protein
MVYHPHPEVVSSWGDTSSLDFKSAQPKQTWMPQQTSPHFLSVTPNYTTFIPYKFSLMDPPASSSGVKSILRDIMLASAMSQSSGSSLLGIASGSGSGKSVQYTAANQEANRGMKREPRGLKATSATRKKVCHL